MPNILLHWFNLFQACFKNYMGFQNPEKKSADEIKEKKNWEKKPLTQTLFRIFKSFKGIQLKILQAVLY